ncbi:MAG TPA: hypothetical protein VED01_02770 [Burkholderiales bacterium]|nr:hypothetical protein [Burkholderiales bacterium]
MPDILKFLSAALIAAAASGCISHGPGGIAYSTDEPKESAVGGTAGTGGGTLSGGSNGEAESKEKRATPPVGTDRHGHGPAAGAIVDPTGAATRGNPY